MSCLLYLKCTRTEAYRWPGFLPSHPSPFRAVIVSYSEELTPPSSPAAVDLAQRIQELSPWFYEFQLGSFTTRSALPQEVRSIFETRRIMLERFVTRHFAGRLENIRVADIGCHEGFYSVALARLGVPEILGIDVRETNLAKARFVSEVLAVRAVRYKLGNCEQLSPADYGTFPLTLCLGLLYHLENPMLCLRNLAALTEEVCLVETQVIDEIVGRAEWGSRAWSRPYSGVLALIDETPEHFSDKGSETGATPLSTCPSPRALEVMLLHAGFRRIEFLEVPPEGYEQLVRGKRVMCAAWK